MVAFGVYVHIPFCTHRCDYCAFATWTDRAHLMDEYAQACIAFLRTSEGAADFPTATSVFFGGGTPSLLPAGSLVRILAAVARTPDAEVTVECNPDTVTPALLDAYLAGGVNRLSFGVQSMAPHVLRGLGRTHSVDAVTSAVGWAVAAGFASWNVDLIFGGFGECDSDWQSTLDVVVDLGAPHVSAYALTVESGTPLARDPARHPDDDVLASRYLMASSTLAAAGLDNYEISNWARPGHECRHNELYWRQGDYLGVGCAAHSHVAGRRCWNVRTPERWISLVADGQSVEAGAETLDVEARRREGLELSLRTRAGVPVGALSEADRLLLAERGLIEPGGRGLVLTVAGRLLANEVTIRLV